MGKHIYNLRKDPIDGRDYKFSTLMEEKLSLPESADLRGLYSEVKDQGSLGACTAFSACSVMEYLLNRNVYLSELYFYYKEREADGNIYADGGSTVRQSAKVATNIGTCREDLCPYNISKFADTPSKDSDIDALNYRTRAYYRLSTIDEIMYTVGMLKKPVLIGIDVYDSLEHLGSDGYISMPDTSKEKLLGGHAVNICGYFWNRDINKAQWWQRPLNFILGKKTYKYEGLFFILRNSWGKDFGDKGYVYASAEFIEKYSRDWWYLTL